MFIHRILFYWFIPNSECRSIFATKQPIKSCFVARVEQRVEEDVVGVAALEIDVLLHQLQPALRLRAASWAARLGSGKV